MKLSRRSVLSAMFGTLALVAFNSAAYAGTALMPMGMEMSGAMMDMATMGITADTVEIPAGEFSFRVVNESQEFYHSMVISPVFDATKELPYLIDKMIVDEAAVGATARVKELKPHDSGLVTVDIQPGTYILYCNVAGHYVMGMWTMITVTA